MSNQAALATRNVSEQHLGEILDAWAFGNTPRESMLFALKVYEDPKGANGKIADGPLRAALYAWNHDDKERDAMRRSLKAYEAAKSSQIEEG